MSDLLTDVMYAAETKGAKGLEPFLPELDKALNKGDVHTVALCFDEIVTLGDVKMVAMIMDLPGWLASVDTIERKRVFAEEGLFTARLHDKKSVVAYLESLYPVVVKPGAPPKITPKP